MNRGLGLWLVWAAVGFAVLVLTAWPLGWLAYGSLRTADGLGFGRYLELFQRFSFAGVLINSWVFALGTTVFAMAVGTVLAVLVARTDIPGKPAIRLVTVLAFVSPPWLTAMAYVFLASPNAGILNVVIHGLVGVKPFDVHSMTGMIVVSGLFLYSFVFLTVESALASVDGSYEEAARIAGARMATVLMRVTLPLVTPALVTAGVFSLIIAWGLFATPAILGMPARIYVFATQLYLFLNAFPPRLELAAAMGMIFCLTAALLGLAIYLVRRPGAAGRYAVIVGKGRRPALMSLGLWRWPALLLTWGVSTLAVFLPFAVIGFMSVNTAWFGDLSLANLSFENYVYVLTQYPNTARVIGNTLAIAAVETAMVLAVALGVAYLAARSDLPGREALKGLATYTVLVPSVAFVTGVLWSWIRPPFALYGTLAIIILAQAARSLPIAVRNLADGFRQLDPALEEAARIAGAGRLRVFGRVVLPLLRLVALSTGTIVFLSALRDLNTPLFLGAGSADTLTLAVTIFLFWGEGRQGESAAFTFVLLALTLAVFLPLYRREPKVQ
ncbi:MAG: iron ABC transporter permease [Alphaproteobacteria bacterium]|nr:iron ABC transporter permease [Alphaproteobacteria bacterium]